MRSLVALAILATLAPAFAVAQDADPRWAGRRPAPAPGHSLDLMLGDPHARRVAPRTDFDGGSYRPAEARRPAPATPPRAWRPRDVESRPLAPGQAD